MSWYGRHGGGEETVVAKALRQHVIDRPNYIYYFYKTSPGTSNVWARKDTAHISDAISLISQIINIGSFHEVCVLHTAMPCQMACYTEPSGKSSLESVSIRAGTFHKYLAGDWMDHLSITSQVVSDRMLIQLPFLWSMQRNRLVVRGPFCVPLLRH